MVKLLDMPALVALSRCLNGHRLSLREAEDESRAIAGASNAGEAFRQATMGFTSSGAYSHGSVSMEAVLDAKVEAFSLKQAGKAEKRLATKIADNMRELETRRRMRSDSTSSMSVAYGTELDDEMEVDSSSASIVGATNGKFGTNKSDIGGSITSPANNSYPDAKTLSCLIGILNTVYADYDLDYSDLRPSAFEKVSLQDAVSTINGYLSRVAAQELLRPTLPSLLEEEAAARNEASRRLEVAIESKEWNEALEQNDRKNNDAASSVTNTASASMGKVKSSTEKASPPKKRTRKSSTDNIKAEAHEGGGKPGKESNAKSSGITDSQVALPTHSRSRSSSFSGTPASKTYANLLASSLNWLMTDLQGASFGLTFWRILDHALRSERCPNTHVSLPLNSGSTAQPSSMYTPGSHAAASSIPPTPTFSSRQHSVQEYYTILSKSPGLGGIAGPSLSLMGRSPSSFSLQASPTAPPDLSLPASALSLSSGQTQDVTESASTSTMETVNENIEVWCYVNDDGDPTASSAMYDADSSPITPISPAFDFSGHNGLDSHPPLPSPSQDSVFSPETLAASGNALWSFAYFFIHKRTHRCVFLACTARHPNYSSQVGRDSQDNTGKKRFRREMNAMRRKKVPLMVPQKNILGGIPASLGVGASSSSRESEFSYYRENVYGSDEPDTGMINAIVADDAYDDESDEDSNASYAECDSDDQ